MQLRGEGEGEVVVAESLLGGVEAIASVEREWRELCAASPWDEPFYRPEWVRIHLEAFEPSARLRLIVARRGGRLVGILPLVEEWATWKGIPYLRLRGAAGVHSCRFDLLLGEGEEEEAVESIWACLRAASRWTVVEVRDVPLGGGMERLMARAARDGQLVHGWESMRTPFISLPANGEMDVFLKGLGGKFRSNLRRRRRRLSEKGELKSHRYDRADPAILEEFYALEAAGWKGRRQTAISAKRDTRRFYDLAAKWAESEGMLALYALRLDHRAVAMHWGLTHGGRYFLPKPAYDEAYASCSPGQILMEEVLEDCIRRGVETFDFLGPSMTWKEDWTQRTRPHHWCFIYRPNPLGRLLFAGKFQVGPWLRGIVARAGRRGANRRGGMSESAGRSSGSDAS